MAERKSRRDALRIDEGESGGVVARGWTREGEKESVRSEGGSKV